MNLTHGNVNGSNNSAEDDEDIVMQELHDEIIRNISPTDVGNLMMARGLLLIGEFEQLVVMRTKGSSELEQNDFLLTCLSRRQAGSLEVFREILIATKACHIEEKIKAKLEGTQTNQSNQSYWKDKYQKLELEMQLKEEEVKKLQHQIDNLISCIRRFQNEAEPYILPFVVQERLTKLYHPESQRSSYYRESDSSPAAAYDLTVASSLGSDSNPPPESHPTEDRCTTPVNLKPPTNIATMLPSLNFQPPTTTPAIQAPFQLKPTPHTIARRPPPPGLSSLSTPSPSFAYKSSSLGAPMKSKSSAFSRISGPNKDTGMDLMRRKFQQVENNEMPENIVALEQRRRNN